MSIKVCLTVRHHHVISIRLVVFVISKDLFMHLHDMTPWRVWAFPKRIHDPGRKTKGQLVNLCSPGKMAINISVLHACEHGMPQQHQVCPAMQTYHGMSLGMMPCTYLFSLHYFSTSPGFLFATVVLHSLPLHTIYTSRRLITMHLTSYRDEEERSQFQHHHRIPSTQENCP